MGITKALSNIIDWLNEFASWLYEAMMYHLGYALGYLSQMIFKSYVFIIDLYDSILNDAFQTTELLYQLSKIPDVIQAFNDYMASDVCYYASSLLLPSLFSGVITAYLIRFGIRRLPIIG